MAPLSRRVNFKVILLLIFCLALAMSIHSAFADKPSVQHGKKPFVKLDAEISEVEESNEPYGAAIYTVKNLSSGETLRLFVHPYRSLIQIGGKPGSAGDALGGSKASIIYQESPDGDMPEVVFARITSSYYS